VSEAEACLNVEVVVVEELGADAFLYGTVRGSGGVDQVVARIDARRPPAKGSTVKLATDADKTHLFDADTGERLSG
jgi:multiple sugar transport system ATP-binding protein